MIKVPKSVNQIIQGPFPSNCCSPPDHSRTVPSTDCNSLILRVWITIPPPIPAVSSIELDYHDTRYEQWPVPPSNPWRPDCKWSHFLTILFHRVWAPWFFMCCQILSSDSDDRIWRQNIARVWAALVTILVQTARRPFRPIWVSSVTGIVPNTPTYRNRELYITLVTTLLLGRSVILNSSAFGVSQVWWLGRQATSSYHTNFLDYIVFKLRF